MKKKLCILILSLGLFGCIKQAKEAETDVDVKTNAHSKNVANSKYYTDQDSLLITTEIGDTFTLLKAEFNEIVDEHPEFFETFPGDPDETYFHACKKEGFQFGSEVGQDDYFVWYAYFLKQRNGVKEFVQQRQKLIDIYSRINSLFGHLEYGGTYFGHQYRRILGYAEYSIYILPKSKEDFYKTYDSTKQKRLYIRLLRQLIEDESKIDFETVGQDKIERIKKLNTIVDELDKLITDLFYLNEAQNFHYEHYGFY
jgi:hypothetical protein